MSEVIGVIQALKRDSNVKTKFGVKEKVSVKVNDEWYSSFLNKELEESLIPVAQNDQVRVTYEVSGKYKNLTEIEVVKKAEPAEVSPVTANVKEAVPTTFVPFNDKDFRITFLASRKDAIEFVKLLVSTGALTLGKVKAKEADILEQAVNEYALRFAKVAFLLEAKDVTFNTTNPVEEVDTAKVTPRE